MHMENLSVLSMKTYGRINIICITVIMKGFLRYRQPQLQPLVFEYIYFMLIVNFNLIVLSMLFFVNMSDSSLPATNESLAAYNCLSSSTSTSC